MRSYAKAISCLTLLKGVVRVERETGGRREIPQLSPREQEVFMLVAQGLTNIQIGKKLFIGEKTVKNYVTKIRKKLGLEHRTQIALYAIREGLLDISQLPDLETRGDFNA